MDRLTEFEPCPLCGSKDALCLTSNRAYEWHKSLFGGYSMVTIACSECGLELTRSNCRNTTNNYHILIGELKKEWAKFKR